MQLWSKGVSYAEQMGFEFGFKMWERVNVIKVRKEWVPKLGAERQKALFPEQGEQWD